MAVTFGVYGATDATGWTVVTLPAGKKRIYVSTTEGNDANDGRDPTPNFAGTGSAGFGGAPLGPKRTIQAGYDACASSDHLLLRKGDTFLNTKIFAPSGDSVDEPFLISSYPDTPGARPVWAFTDFSMNTPIWSVTAPTTRLAVIGIDFDCQVRNPNHVNYDSTPNNDQGGPGLGGGCELFIFEDNKVQFFAGGPAISDNSNVANGLYIRRNQFVDQYSATNQSPTSQGLFLSNYGEDVVIEENLFDHNGWNEDVAGGVRGSQSHNIYVNSNVAEFSDLRPPIGVRGNIFARDSAQPQLRNCSDISDNFFVENPISLAMLKSVHGVTYDVHHNVITEPVWLAQDPAHGIVYTFGITGNYNGKNTWEGTLLIRDNILCHATSSSVGRAIILDYPGIDNVDAITDNIIWHWATTSAEEINSDGASIVSGNIVHEADVNDGLDGAPTYVGDPTGTTGDYAASISLTGTTAALLAAARENYKDNYDERLTANYINNWFRNNFDEPAYPAAEGVTSIGGRPLRAMRFR